MASGSNDWWTEHEEQWVQPTFKPVRQRQRPTRSERNAIHRTAAERVIHVARVATDRATIAEARILELEAKVCTLELHLNDEKSAAFSSATVAAQADIEDRLNCIRTQLTPLVQQRHGLPAQPATHIDQLRRSVAAHPERGLATNEADIPVSKATPMQLRHAQKHGTFSHPTPASLLARIESLEKRQEQPAASRHRIDSDDSTYDALDHPELFDRPATITPDSTSGTDFVDKGVSRFAQGAFFMASYSWTCIVLISSCGLCFARAVFRAACLQHYVTHALPGNVLAFIREPVSRLSHGARYRIDGFFFELQHVNMAGSTVDDFGATFWDGDFVCDTM